MFHEMQLGFEWIATQNVSTMINSLKLHWIALKSRVVIGTPKAFMSSQYWYGKSRSDMSHNVHEACITNCTAKCNMCELSSIVAQRPSLWLRHCNNNFVCTRVGLLLGSGIALVPVKESWCWLAIWLTFASGNSRGSRRGGCGLHTL